MNLVRKHSLEIITRTANVEGLAICSAMLIGSWDKESGAMGILELPWIQSWTH